MWLSKSVLWLMVCSWFIFSGMASYNPWMVNSVHDFWFLKCPECSFDSKEEESFQAHALEEHPLSFALFGKTVKEEAFDTG